METPSFWLSKRFFVAILVFLGQLVEFVSYGTMNIAIVAMTSRSTTMINNQTIWTDAEFNWDSRTKGIILSASSIGSIFAGFVGYLAMKYGGSTMATIASLLSSIMTLLVPTVSYSNVYLLCIVEVIDGLGAQMKFSSTAEVWRQWAPLKERSRLITIGYSGGYAGTVVAYPLCGFIIHKFGWPAAFYFSGGLCLSWMLLWFFMVPNDPSNDKFISQNELNYIKRNLENTKLPNYKTIYKKMIKSKVILAICSIDFVSGICFTIIATSLPMFVKDITDAPTVTVGILACIPNLLTLFAIPLFGYVADTLQSKGLLTITQIHKLYVCNAYIGGSVILFVVAYYSSIFITSMVCLTFFKLITSFGIVVVLSISNFVAPKCPSVVISFIEMFFFLGIITGQVMIGFIVISHDALQWSTSFCAFGVLSIIGGTLFVTYGSSEPQPWSYVVDDESVGCGPVVSDRNTRL